MIKERTLFKKIEPFIQSKEALVVTGMRRVGKTSLLQYFFNKIVSKNKIFIDLENPVNQKYFEETDYERIKLSLEILGVNFSTRSFIFIDEIQLLKNIPSIIKYFIDHYNVKFFLTGSASYYLKNLFAESLSGRKYIFELYPLTFREFLIFKEINIENHILALDTKKDLNKDNIPHIPKAIYNKLSTLYDEYMEFGGFPEVVLKDSVSEKIKSIEDIFSSYYQLEVLRIGDFRKNNIIRDLILLLMQRTGSKLDITKISKELSVTRQTLSEYISFLEQTYFIKTIKPFSTGRDSELRKTPKLYICDSGIANHFARLSKGSLFENCIFLNFLQYGDVKYFQKKSGVEIDFILNANISLEVKTNPDLSDIKKLNALSSEIGIKNILIISKTYTELDNTAFSFSL